MPERIQKSAIKETGQRDDDDDSASDTNSFQIKTVTRKMRCQKKKVRMTLNSKTKANCLDYTAS